MSFKERMYLRSFQDISKILGSTLATDEILDQIVRQITEVMSLKGATIRLVNPKTNTLELVASVGLSEKYLKKGKVDLDKSIAEALSGRPVAIFDATTDSRLQYPQQAKEEGIATLVAIPMVSKGKVIGVMRLVTGEPREFTMEEVDFACAVAELGAQAISNAKLYEARTTELNLLKGLLEISKAVNSALDVKKVLHLLVKTATTALDIKAAAVRLLDEKRQKMELVASYGLSDRYINKGPVGTDKSLTEAMMGKAVSIYDVAQDPHATYPKEAAEEGIKSILSVPINLKGNVIGV
jgi:signal transduction protein with GAF and PtsI domain